MKNLAFSKTKAMFTTILTSILLLTSCFTDIQTTTFSNKYDTLSNSALQKEYQKQLQKITLKKNRIDSIDSLGIYLHNQLTTEVFPAWYGTKWDYNGYTNTPRKGIIACGYFVSTTLKHVGFNLNRYDLAKMYSSSIVKSLCGTSNTFTDIDNLFAYLLAKEDDLYVVGLSSHVGFIEKKGNQIYFIHSNYIGPVAVEKEIAKESDALNSSDIFVLGNITGNSELIEKWKHNTRIEVIK